MNNDGKDKDKVDVSIEVHKGSIPENILDTANIGEFVIGQDIEDKPILNLSCRAAAKVSKTNDKNNPMTIVESLSIHSFQLLDTDTLAIKPSLESEE